MNPEQQRIAIAGACGWSLTEPIGDSNYACWKKEGTRKVLEGLPDYLSDLNAMHEAEKVLVFHQRTEYCVELRKIVARDATVEMLDPDTGRLTDLAFYGATAAQRAEAFLRALARQIANDTPDIRQLSVNNALRLWRALRSLTLCAEMALETMPHGSDRYDLAVAVDAANEALK